MFATLTYNHSGLEIDSVQAISQEGFYRFEALTADGRMYVKNDLTYEETFELFTISLTINECQELEAGQWRIIN